MPSASFKNNQNGFTLIEIMVAMAILAGLSILIAQTIKTSFDSRAKVQADLARESQVYDALRIMQNDVASAFHYHDYTADTTPDASPAPGAGAPPAGTPHPTPVEVTGFVGEKDSLYFTVFNHARTIKDAAESDQAKVGYFLKDCHAQNGKGDQSKCLFRAVSPDLDDDVTKISDEMVLVQHVDEFKLRYLGPNHEDYVDTWKTGLKSADQTTKNSFPYAVEITLVILNKNDRKDRPFGATVLAPIRFPNNPTPTPAPAGQNTTTTTTTAAPDFNNLTGPSGAKGIGSGQGSDSSSGPPGGQ